MTEETYKQLLELALNPLTNQLALLEQLSELYETALSTYHKANT